MTPSLCIAPEVQDALADGGPVVALESTIITHGMPPPDNLTTARLVEDEVRRAGATPATIAILDGALHVALEGDRRAFFGRLLGRQESR